MAIDLDAKLDAATAERIGRQSDSSTNFLALMDRTFLKVVTEADTMEAAAARQVMHKDAPIGS